MSTASNPTSHQTPDTQPTIAQSMSETLSTGKRRRPRISRQSSSQSLIRVTVSNEENATVTHRNMNSSEMVKARDVNAGKADERRDGFEEYYKLDHNYADRGGESRVPPTVVNDNLRGDRAVYPYAKRGGMQGPHTLSMEIERPSSYRERGKDSNSSSDKRNKRSANLSKREGLRPKRKSHSTPKKQKSTPEPVRYTSPLVEAGEPIRLNKYLSNSGLCSRRVADRYIATGRVKVNGVIVLELGSQVMSSDQVMVDDKQLSLEEKVYVLLNKPKNCVTTLTDPEGRRTVIDLVHNACAERIYPIGRLDRNTTGVLLLTNDGDLAVRLMHPAFRKKKIYEVALDKEIPVEHMQMIARGFELEDGEIHADAISYITGQTHDKVGIEIHSGRNRIVRRIFEHLGYRVVHLDRVYYAGLTKKDLPRGRWRYLTPEEVRYLRMGIKEQEEVGASPTTKVYHKQGPLQEHPFESEAIED